MVEYIGRNASADRPDWGYISPGQMRGYTPNAVSQHLWVYQLGLWGGKNTNESATNVTARVGLYATSSGSPAGRMGYSDAATVSAAMTDSVSGAAYTMNVGTVDVAAPSGWSFSGIPVASGSVVHLAVLGTSGYLSHGMIAAGKISATYESFYNRIGLSQPPPNPFGAFTSSNEGHMSVWAVADANVAPATPSSLSPTGTITGTTPTMTAAFSDANENRGDYLNQFRIQVRRKSDSVSFWNTTLTSTSGERTADAFTRAYGGTTLAAGTTYQWRTQVSDHFDTWSSWTSWTDFTPAASGVITLNGTPSGWTTDNTPDFQGRWNHATSVSMKRVQVRILNQSGSTVIQTGADYDIADVSSSAAPGTLFTVAWANAGLTQLADGVFYTYQMRGYDGTTWSNWSAGRAFNTNAPPSIPALNSPANGLATSARPLLEMTVTDTDTAVGTLTVSVEILDTSNAVLGTYAATWHAGTQRYRLQTTSTHLPSIGVTRRWRAFAFDGYLYSGGATTSGAATRSASREFTYAAVPAVTVTAPTNPVTVASPTVTWTTTGQVNYRVRLYLDDGSDALVYDSGTVVSATASHVIPSGYLHNGQDYYIVVSVTDGSTLTGDSAQWPFTVAYTPADAIQNLNVSAVSVGTDLWASAISLTWDQTAYSLAVWQEYTVTVNGLIIARITSPSQTSFVYHTPASGIEQSFEVTQSILTGTDILTSDPVTGAATVALGGVVLVSVESPSTLRTSLRYTNERTYDRTIAEAVYVPVNGERPTTVRDRAYYRSVSLDAQLFADRTATSATRRTEVEAIDRDGGTYCYRDNHGRKMFVTIPKVSITDHVPDWYVVSLELRQEEYIEGVQDD
jgi:hypothetical protein